MPLSETRFGGIPNLAALSFGQVPYFSVDSAPFNATGDGTTNDAVAIQRAIDAAGQVAPAVVLLSGKTYAVAATLVMRAGVTIQGTSRSTLKATAAITDVLATTDNDNVAVRDVVFDANSLAINGFSGYSITRSPDNIILSNCWAINTPIDNTLNFGGFRFVAMGGSSSPNRSQNVKLLGCRAKNCGTLGAAFAYCDYAEILDWSAENIQNHGFEFVGCTHVNGDVLRGKNCGGSGVGVGGGTYYFNLSNIDLDGCTGDGAITVETNSVYGRVSNFRIINCVKPGISCNYAFPGTAPTDLLQGVEFSHGLIRAAGAKTITNITKANPAIVTAPSHGMRTITGANTIQLAISGVLGMTAINGLSGTITIIDANTFSIAIDTTGFATYTSGGVANVQNSGVNMYGSVPNLMQDMALNDVDIDGFNVGLTFLYAQGCSIDDIRVTRLQGPLSSVAKFTAVRQGTLIRGVRCFDSTTTDAAFQFLTYAGGPTPCDQIQVVDCFCFLAGAGATKPLVYLEGNGSVSFVNLRTGGALNYVACKAGDTPTLVLLNSQGGLTGSATSGTPVLVQSLGNFSGLSDFAVIGGRMVFGATSVPTTGTHNQGERAINTAYAVNQPIEWVCTATGTPGTWIPVYLPAVGQLASSGTALTNGAAAAAGTLANAPAVGNPTKWIPINDAGTTRYIPAW